MAESSYNQKLISCCGAVGIMQVMPRTAKMHGYNAYNKEQNIHAGVKHLSMLLKSYGGNETLAIAAYNAGCGNVNRCNGGIPKYTKHYVMRVQQYKKFNYELL